MADLWGYEHLLNKPIIQNRSHVVDFMGSAMKEAGGAFTRYQALKAAEAEKAAGRQHEKDMFGLQNDAQNERFGKEMDLKGQQFGLENERYQSGQRAEAMKRNLAPVESVSKQIDIPEAWELAGVRGKVNSALSDPALADRGMVGVPNTPIPDYSPDNPYLPRVSQEQQNVPGPWAEGATPSIPSEQFIRQVTPEIEAGTKAWQERLTKDKLRQTYAAHPRDLGGSGPQDKKEGMLLGDLQDAQKAVAQARSLKVTDELVLGMARQLGVSPEAYIQRRMDDAKAWFDSTKEEWVNYNAGRGIYGAGAPAPKPQGQPVFQPQPIQQPQAQPDPARINQFNQRKAQLKGDPNARATLEREFPDLAGM